MKNSKSLLLFKNNCLEKEHSNDSNYCLGTTLAFDMLMSCFFLYYKMVYFNKQKTFMIESFFVTDARATVKDYIWYKIVFSGFL